MKSEWIQGRSFQDLTTYYMSNFPGNFKVIDLWRSFRKWGRVLDVFIPEKRNIGGQRFAFVRFRQVRDVKELERKMDNTSSWNRRIHVNIPRFHQEDVTMGQTRGEGERAHETQNHKGHRRYAHALGIGKRNDVTTTEVKGRGGRREQRVSSTSEDNWKRLEVNIEPEGMQWLKKCLVGEVLSHEKVNEIKTAFEVEGYCTVNIIPMGDRYVLMSSVDGEDIHEVLKDADEWLHTWFEDIAPWSKKCVVGNRYVWIKCYEIPSHAWNERVFRTIVGSLLSFIATDVETRDRSRLDVARIQVKTSTLYFINIIIRIKIKGSIFAIRLVEENECECIHKIKSKMVKENGRRTQESEESSRSEYSDHVQMGSEYSGEWVPHSFEGRMSQEIEILESSGKELGNIMKEEEACMRGNEGRRMSTRIFRQMCSGCRDLIRVD